MKRRTLSLKREPLQELSTDELTGMAGGKPSDWSCASCMTYVSCHFTDCIGNTLNTCVVTLDTCA